MSACQCKTTSSGTIVCDACAAQMIAAISDLLPGDQYAQQLPNTLTASEHEGLQSVVNGWLSSLQPNNQGRA